MMRLFYLMLVCVSLISFQLTAKGKLTGQVVDQSFIQLNYLSKNRKQQHVTIRRRTFALKDLPYHGRKLDPMLDTMRVKFAKPVYQGKIRPDKEGSWQFEDKNVQQDHFYVYWVVQENTGNTTEPLCLKVRNPQLWWSQEKINRKMHLLAKRFPDLVRQKTFGYTTKGNPVNGLVIGNTNNAIGLIGNLHAGESGAELQLYAAEELLKHNRIMLKNAGIVMIPSLNIDARNRLINGVPDYQRKNANGVDLNRNFPADWSIVDHSYDQSTDDPSAATYRGKKPASEPETQVVIDLVENFKPRLVFSYHWMGCITGNKFLLYQKEASLKTKAEKLARIFSEGFNKTGDDFNSGGTLPGSLPRYVMTKHKIPAYDLEGNRQDSILNKSYHDHARPSDLKIYQEKHYKGLKKILNFLGR